MNIQILFFKLGKMMRQNAKSSQNDIGRKTCQNPSAFIRAKKNDFIPVSFIRIRFAKG